MCNDSNSTNLKHTKIDSWSNLRLPTDIVKKRVICDLTIAAVPLYSPVELIIHVIIPRVISLDASIHPIVSAAMPTAEPVVIQSSNPVFARVPFTVRIALIFRVISVRRVLPVGVLRVYIVLVVVLLREAIHPFE